MLKTSVGIREGAWNSKDKVSTATQTKKAALAGCGRPRLLLKRPSHMVRGYLPRASSSLASVTTF
jgi:hypothetical protein